MAKRTAARRGSSSSSVVKVYFATNRDPNRADKPDKFGGKFNPDSADSIRFGVARCSIRGKEPKLLGIETAPEKMGKDKEAKHLLGSKHIFAELQTSMRKGVDTLVFIHGYNVSFEQALETGAWIHKRYRTNLNVVVFSWPSDGKMTPILAYKRDRSDAVASAPAFARAMLKLKDFLIDVRRKEKGKKRSKTQEGCGAKIHLMAHSMGNYVLRNGIQEAMRHERLPRLFDQIFLMAADEDDDSFEKQHKLRPLPEFGNGVNIYFNRGDTALVISDRTKNNPTRLGSQGPREPLNVPANVTNIDASEIVSGFVEHSYFYEDRRVVADVERVLRGQAHDRIPKRRYVASQNRYVLKE